MGIFDSVLWKSMDYGVKLFWGYDLKQIFLLGNTYGQINVKNFLFIKLDFISGQSIKIFKHK